MQKKNVDLWGISFALVIVTLFLLPTLTSSKEADMDEITTKDLVRMGDIPLTLVGPQLKIGQKLPDATLVDGDMQEVLLSTYFGKILIISTVPSLDTPVCNAQTRHFNLEASSLGPQVQIITISNDLPFAQKRFCAAEGITQVKVLSDYRGQQFARAAGLFIKENWLLARTVEVVDQRGIVRYIQIVPVLGQEPDYEPVIEAVKKLQ
ncbi:MAG: thiol peroxidase [bacterium]|nr:thiol peroxidase [bacterium]